MPKLRKRLRQILTGLTLAATATAWSQSFTQGDLVFTVLSESGKTVGVKAANTDVTAVTIPETVSNNGVTYTVTELNEEAFANCKTLAELNLPKTIKKSGLKAFYYCGKLKKVNVTDLAAFLQIEYAAANSNPISSAQSLYLNGTLVTEINIPEGWTEIKDWAIYNNNSLKKINMPNSVKKIGQYGINNNRNLTSVKLSENLEVIGRNGMTYLPLLEYVVPNSVKEIGQYGLSYNQKLKKLTFPENMEVIPDYCTYWNKAMAECVLPKNVKRIGRSAFSTTGLVKFVIPETVTFVDALAFNGDDQLESVTIGSKVDTIGTRAFWTYSKAVKYKEIIIRRATPPVTLKESNGNLETFFPGIYEQATLFVPKNATEAYKDVEPWSRFKNIKEIDIDAVGKETVQGDLKFTVTSNTDFEAKVSAANKNIATANIPVSFKYNGFDYTVNQISENGFDGCSKLTSVSVPASIAQIGKNAFNACKTLNKVDVADLASWVNIDFADSTANPLAISKKLFVAGTETASLRFPDSITNIKPYAFFGAEGLTRLVMNDSIDQVGAYAFNGCTDIKAITLKGKLKKVGDYAFAKTGIQFLTVTDSTATYGKGVFANCPNLTNVTFKGAMKKTGIDMFAECKNLKYLEFNDNIDDLAKGIFRNTGIIDLKLPLYLHKIGENAFADCQDLSSVEMAMEVTSIGPKAFFTDDSKIKSVVVKGSTPPVCTASTDGKIETFADNVYNQATLIIPKKATEKFKAAEPWSKFRTIQEADFSDIEERVFTEGIFTYTLVSSDNKTVSIGAAEPAKITEAVIPTSVTNTSNGRYYTVVGITDNGFKNCVSLKSIQIPPTINSIGKEAFSGCTALDKVNITDLAAWCGINFVSNPATTAKKLYINGKIVNDLVIPAGVATISDNAFNNVESIQTLSTPESLKTIGYRAFYGCSKLKEAKFTQSLRYISDQAFDHASIADLILPDSLNFGREVFENNTSLKHVRLPKTLKVVPFCTFFRCSALTDIDWPDSLRYIEQSGFTSTGIKKLILPESLDSICMYGVYNCNSLMEIEIGSNLKSMGVCAFFAHGGSPIKKVTCHAKVPPLANTSSFGTGVFFAPEVYTNATLYVPYSSMDAYKKAECWKEFKRIVGLPDEGVDEIDNGDKIKVSVSGSEIVLPEENDVRVYSADGRCVFSGHTSTVNPGAKGLYIVVVEGKAYKIMI